MSEERTPRKSTSRKVDERPTDTWKPASILPDPEPQDGYVFRWVKTSLLGQSDNTHVSKMFREGWQPVRAEDHPELMLESDIGSKFEGNIEVGGLLLCKAPIELVEERNEYYETQTSSQMQSVDNNLMRESDPRMPIFNDRKTKVSFGNGT